MTTDHPSFLGDVEVARELADARRRLTALLDDVREFSTLLHAQPWVHLDDLLAELRAAATTVAVLEGLQARRL